VLLHRLIEQFGSLSAAWSATAEQLQLVSGIGGKTLSTVLSQRLAMNPEQLLANHQDQDFWVPCDPEYPRLLLEIGDFPPVLYYRGQVVRAENQGVTPAIAIVGTRDPSEYAKRWTRKMAYALGKNGFTVVSGLAEGIDTQAHIGCLEAGGRTIAVLGTGVDTPYPQRNQTLYQSITEKGLVLSEHPAGTQPHRSHFPKRNRIIAGLSRATLVMEAPSKSGALITAYQANEYGRDVYVLPNSLDNIRAVGCLGLLQRGAQAMLGVGQLLDMLGAMPTLERETPSKKQKVLPPLTTEQATLVAVLRRLTDAAVPFDVLVEQTQISAGELSSALLQLELLEVVVQHPGMRYSLNLGS
jgi:DNA processing protein